MFRQRIRIGITWRPALVVMLLLPSLARSQQDTPAPLNWESHTASAIDLSRFLIPPAGQSGFVRADGERLVDGNGKRVRLWGVNLGGPACFPTHEQAEALADSFARMGFNCVRFHGLDSNWGRSSIDRSGGDTLSLNESDLERFDYLDGHGYWQHPSIGAVTRTGNDPMVNDPADSTIVQFARTPMVGKPFVVSETNHPYPHVYAVEGIPLMTTYAMLQDWDGVLFHEWGDGTYHPSASIPRNGWFQLSRDPLKVAELVLSGLLWHRNDIRPASQLIIRESTLPELRQNSRVQPWRHRPFFDDAFPKTLPLLHRTRWRLVETPNQANYPADPGIADLKSDTGQLRWHGADRDRGRVVIDATRVQGLVGFQGDERNRGYAGTELISVDLRNEFAAVVLASLDDQPIRSSKRMLLLVGDRSANQDLTWQDDGETVANWGEGPVVIRRVEGVIRIAGWNASRTPRVTVLDSLGCRTDETWPAEYRGGRWHITAGSPPGLMALIER